MNKTASQIADQVVAKLAADSDSDERLRNALVGGLGGAVDPLLAGIAASASKPEGDDTSQFWGTLGGSLGGRIAGAGLGHGIGRALGTGSVAPRVLGMLAGGGGGGYGAQRLMASRRGDNARKNIDISQKQLKALGQD